MRRFLARIAIAALLVAALAAPQAAHPARATGGPSCCTAYALPSGSQGFIYGTAMGPDGNLWYTDFQQNRVYAISTSGTLVHSYAVPTPGAQPTAMTVGLDGNLWFLEQQTNKVARLTTAGAFTEFTIPTAASMPAGITWGPDGNVWLTERASSKVARLTPSGQFAEFQLPNAPAQPTGIAVGPDGNLWLALYEGDTTGSVARVTPSGVITDFPIPPPCGGCGVNPDAITAGWDGNLWVFTDVSHEIIRVTTSGSMQRVSLGAANCAATPWITWGSDGNVWFTDWCDDAIGSITPSGTVTEYHTTDQNIRALTTGPDGNLWFVEDSSLEQLTIPPPTYPGPPTSVHASGGSEFAELTWRPPFFSGGSAISDYVVTEEPGGQIYDEPPGATAAIIPNLTNGSTYTFSIAAVNATGEGWPAYTGPITPAPFPVQATTGRPWTGGHDAIGVPAPSTDFYFAEGYTGANFQEYLTIQNPGAAQTATVVYLFSDGSSLPKDYQLPADGRTTIDVNSEVGPGREVAAHVYAVHPIVVERPMYFDYNGWTGGHDVMGATALGNTFYFAEGYTGTGFQEYLTLADPNSSDAVVDITYFRSDGTTKVVTKTIPATSRVTVNVNDPAEGVGPGWNVSIQVANHAGNSVSFLAERPMYFDYNGKWTGGDDVAGSAAPINQLDLAEGYVSPGQFDEYLTILNAGGADAHLTITYDCQSPPPGATHCGSAGAVTQTVGAHSRGTRLVNSDFPGLTVSESVHISSDQPVLVERPMYFNYGPGWNGGHDAVAADDAVLSSSYSFAEGYAAPNFHEYLTVLNPNAYAVTVTIEYFLQGGGTDVVSFDVPAGSRGTRDVNSDFPAQAVSQSVTVSAVRSGTLTQAPVLVERPMYFSY